MPGSRDRDRKRKKKIQPGDGRPVAPFRSWHMLWRSQFLLDTAAPDGTLADQYAVDVNFFDWDGKAHLYKNGRRAASAVLPAAFPVPGGHIEVATSTYGLKRMHLVGDDGLTRQLRPHPKSGEAWRARLDHRFPRVSRLIAATAVVVLLVSLALLVPQLIEMITSIPVVAERVGVFTSPIALPEWLNSILVVAGVLAGIERALSLRSHWLIDADTWWLSD